MSTTPSLLDQFQPLYKALNLPEASNRLIKDGITNEALFAIQKIKLLIIAKEHNTLPTDELIPEEELNYQYWGNKHVKFTFAHRISEWAWGLQNGFAANLDSLTYEQKHEAFRSIAFINVKKTTGGALSNPDVIHRYIAKTKDLLQQQILEIAPNLILCCFRYNEYVNSLFGIRMDIASDGKCGIGEWQGIKVINFFHPSSRKNKYELYKALKQVAGEIDSKTTFSANKD